MNILPKKSWHVRTKRNIERVRRDEANAAAEERAKEERRLLAEQEARTAYLRAKAKQKPTEPAEKSEHVHDAGSSKHVNFFEDIEEAGKYFGKVNKEHEEEKKAEQEEFEKRIGLLTYLGQSALESKEKQPWYLKSHSERHEQDGDTTRNEKKRSINDPLNDIRQYLDQRRKRADGLGKHSSKSRESDDGASKRRHKHKKQRKESEVCTNKKTVEEMRRERLERERAERKRAQELLAKRRGEPKEPTDERTQPRDIQQRYNSQFNPHLARQNMLQ